MKKVNLVEFTDLLSHATTIGYTWNGAHDILDADNIRPMYEVNQKTFYSGEFDMNDNIDEIVVING